MFARPNGGWTNTFSVVRYKGADFVGKKARPLFCDPELFDVDFMARWSVCIRRLSRADGGKFGGTDVAESLLEAVPLK